MAETDLDDVVDAIQELRRAVEKSTITYATVPVLFVILIGWCFDIVWHSNIRYAIEYSVARDKITVDPEPHDCNFLAAPMGLKYCKYERTFQVIRWGKAQDNGPLISYDDGKNWESFVPPQNAVVPQYSTPEELYVHLERKPE